jgi:hypothetical protein
MILIDRSEKERQSNILLFHFLSYTFSFFMQTMIQATLLVVLVYFVAIINTKPIVQSKDYEVKKKVINTPVNEIFLQIFFEINFLLYRMLPHLSLLLIKLFK